MASLASLASLDHATLIDALRITNSAIASAVNGIAVGDLDGRIIYGNAAGLKMIGGYALDEVLGLSILTFADSQEEAARIFDEVLNKGSWSGEVAGRKRDGSIIVVHLSASLVRGEDGQPLATLCSFIDITQTRQMLDTLRITNSAISSAVNGIAFGDLEGRITYGNAAALEMIGGYAPEEVLGLSALTFADSQEEAARIFAEVLEKGRWIGEVAGRKRDGSIIVVHLSASLVRGEDGQPLATLCSFIDVTHTRKAFEELRLKDQAIASSVTGMVFGDQEARITYANPAAYELLGGYTPEEVRGRSVLSFADSPEEADRIFTEFLEKGSWIGEVVGRKKDGSIIIVHLSASLVRDESGEPVCSLCSFIDVTPARQAMEELRLKDYAIASSLNAIVFGDLEGRITYVNKAFLDLWGSDDPSEVLGRSVMAFARAEEEFERILQHVFDERSWQGEVTARVRDGRLVIVQISAHLVTDERGRPICLMCAFMDVTEKNRAQEDLRRTLDELEQRVAARTVALTESNEKLRREIEDRRLAERNLRKKERELELNALHLEQTNTALKVLLEQREKDKNELEEMVLANVRSLVLPCLEKLRACRLNDRQKVYVDVLDTNLQTIISPFLHRLSNQFTNLTATEIQVAGLVKEGKTSKEIAELINVSERGVEFHRNNIRRKLGLKSSKKNLRTYLMSLS